MKSFFRKYKSYYGVVFQSRGRIGFHPGLIARHLTSLGIKMDDDLAVMQAFNKAASILEQEFIAYHFLCSS